MSTLEGLAARALDRDPSEPAFEFDQRWYNWGELRRVADRIGAMVEATGADPRAPVAFVSRNRPSAVATLLSLIRMGRQIRMVYAFQSPVSLASNIERLRPGIVVAMEEDVSDELRSVLREKGIAGIALGKMDARAIPGCEQSTAEWGDPLPALEIQVLTSGTTGVPKQFSVSYDMIAKHMVGANMFVAQQTADATPEPPMFLYPPLGNISGIYSFIPVLAHGVRFILVDRFTIREWHDYVLRYRPEKLGLPPAGVQMVLDADIPVADLASIRWLSTGAAPLDPTVQRAFQDRYGIPVLQSYGATEFAGPVAAMTPELYLEWGEKKFGTVGRPFPGIRVRVVDPQTGNELPPGTEGLLELVVPRIGPNWIRTSDLVVLDEDGFLFHRGRSDGAIMRGGFKILPETIERALVLHDAVSAAGVVAIADRRLGQVPAAVIQLKPGVEAPTEDALKLHLRNHVLATHVPVHWRFVPELPKNPSFKIDRPALKRLFEIEDGVQGLS